MGSNLSVVGMQLNRNGKAFSREQKTKKERKLLLLDFQGVLKEFKGEKVDEKRIKFRRIEENFQENICFYK